MNYLQSSHLDAERGESENRSEMYLEYIERESELLTKFCAKSRNSVSISDGEQVSAVGGLQ